MGGGTRRTRGLEVRGATRVMIDQGKAEINKGALFSLRDDGPRWSWECVESRWGRWVNLLRWSPGLRGPRCSQGINSPRQSRRLRSPRLIQAVELSYRRRTCRAEWNRWKWCKENGGGQQRWKEWRAGWDHQRRQKLWCCATNRGRLGAGQWNRRRSLELGDKRPKVWHDQQSRRTPDGTGQTERTDKGPLQKQFIKVRSSHDERWQ